MFAVLLSFALLQSTGMSSNGRPPHEQEASDPIAQAKISFAAGNFSEAQAAYEDALRIRPDNKEAQDGEVEASERLALALRASHDMNDSLGELLRAQKFAPDSEKLLYDLGVLEDEIGLYHDADTIVTRLRRLSPGDLTVDYLAARVKLDLGQLQEAETAMRAYLAARPNDATAHYGLGRIYQLGQNNQKAKAEFLESVELMPEQTESQYQLADIALKEGRYKSAIDEAAKVLMHNPHHGGALTDTGIAYFRTKQYEQARDVLLRAVAEASAYQPAHYYLGLTLARLGDKQASDQELATAARLADEDNSKSAQRLSLKP